MDTLANHIILIGFMGSGKSSVARRLARFERMNCIDMDSYIEREAGMSIPRIFELEGEEGFRLRELDLLRSMLIRDRCVLSCGGGVIVHDKSRELLEQLGTVVYLEVDADEAISRISRPETRPLLSGGTPPAELLASRLRYYETVADITVDTRGRSVQEVTVAAQCALRDAGKLPPSGKSSFADGPQGSSRSPRGADRPQGSGRSPQGAGRPPQGSGRSPQGAGRPPQGSGRSQGANRPQGSGGKQRTPGRPPRTGSPQHPNGKPRTPDRPQTPDRTPRARRSSRSEGKA